MAENETGKKMRGKILIVDDEEAYLKIFERILSKIYIVKTALNGAEGLEILKKGFNPGLILSDQKMPGMSGAEFLEQSIFITPDAIRIIITGFTEPKDIIASVNRGKAFMYLKKPMTDMEIFQAAYVAFEYYNSIIANKNAFEESKTIISLLNEKNDISQKMVEELKVEVSDAVQLLEIQKNEISDLNTKHFNAVNENVDLKDSINLLNSQIEKLILQNEEKNRLINDYKTFPNQTMVAIAKFIQNLEKLYFTPHTEYVQAAVKAVASDMKLNTVAQSNLVIATMLHGFIFSGMPDKYRITDPNELNETDRKTYFDIFLKNVNTIFDIDLFKKAALLISQIWERQDGSGFPKGLRGDQILPESQILSLSFLYHNKVYGITSDGLDDLRKNGKIIQPTPITSMRHKEFIKSLYRSAAKYDVDVFHSFHQVVKDKDCYSLMPSKELLTLDLSDYYLGSLETIEQKYEGEPDENLREEEDIIIP